MIEPLPILEPSRALIELFRFIEQEKRNLHPFAFKNKSGGNSGTGREVHSGDRIRYDLDGRTGVLDECLYDGDAFVTWDDGSFGTVKWNHLSPENSKKD